MSVLAKGERGNIQLYVDHVLGYAMLQNANVDFFCVRVPEVNQEKEEEHKWLVISPQM